MNRCPECGIQLQTAGCPNQWAHHRYGIKSTPLSPEAEVQARLWELERRVAALEAAQKDKHAK